MINHHNVLKGYCHDNFAVSHQICGEIMNPKQETLLKPQEEVSQAILQGRANRSFFSVEIFSSCSPY